MAATSLSDDVSAGWSSQRATTDDRPLTAAAPTVWNNLPEEVRSITSTASRLKFQLFKRSFGPRHSTWLASVLDPETGLQALPTLFLLSYFQSTKALLFLNQSL